MKAHREVSLGLLISLACWVGHAQAQDFEISGEIKHAGTAGIVLDGKPDDAAWATANAYSDFFHAASDPPDDEEDLSATWRALWDDTNLYFFVEVTDDETIVGDSNDWQDDSIEFYLDAQALGKLPEDFPDIIDYGPGFGPNLWPVYQLTILAGEDQMKNGVNFQQWVEYNDDEDIVNGVALFDGTNYSLEVAFSWESLDDLGESPSAILERGFFGLGMAINDDDDGGERDSQIMWATDNGELWHDATVFPNVELLPAGGQLEAGDSDMDYDFDQFDLIMVQQAAKYLNGQAATWGEGDWNGAPGGAPGDPPPGNGFFDQLDIIAALGTGNYLGPPYFQSLQPEGGGDGNVTIVYNEGTGEVSIEVPGTSLTSINIDSDSGIFVNHENALQLDGSFDTHSEGNIFKATFGSSFGSLSFGEIAATGLAEDVVRNDLTAVGSLEGGGGLGAVDFVYIPEPSTIMLLGLGLAGMLLMCIRRTA